MLELVEPLLIKIVLLLTYGYVVSYSLVVIIVVKPLPMWTLIVELVG